MEDAEARGVQVCCDHRRAESTRVDGFAAMEDEDLANGCIEAGLD